jgi:hypothetical protein
MLSSALTMVPCFRACQSRSAKSVMQLTSFATRRLGVAPLI